MQLGLGGIFRRGVAISRWAFRRKACRLPAGFRLLAAGIDHHLGIVQRRFHHPGQPGRSSARPAALRRTGPHWPGQCRSENTGTDGIRGIQRHAASTCCHRRSDPRCSARRSGLMACIVIAVLKVERAQQAVHDRGRSGLSRTACSAILGAFGILTDRQIGAGQLGIGLWVIRPERDGRVQNSIYGLVIGLERRCSCGPGQDADRPGSRSSPPRPRTPRWPLHNCRSLPAPARARGALRAAMRSSSTAFLEILGWPDRGC